MIYINKKRYFRHTPCLNNTLNQQSTYHTLLIRMYYNYSLLLIRSIFILAIRTQSQDLKGDLICFNKCFFF